ncbi:short-chain dehydrogenase/reductase [Mycolicibacter icosiumassiliensis]|uniref:short-chain dehydrogenase/reductase n=1 Tax=Mycolicibacter icosiumassiliensis TaxID=1792835 RepID=UPI000829F882|nr:short-chain dehydrogenase/reductase [Mycolicibacter icosiumassiliensis]
MTAKSHQGLRGKVVAITGAANGIGAATARQLTLAGARVALLDCDEVALMRLAAELGDAAAGFVADVTDPDSIDSAVRATAACFGGIDAVVANAGIAGPVATVSSVEPADLEQIVQVNLLGVFRTVRAALPYVTERRGYVLLVSSIMALIPSPTVAGYAATKAGVEAFGRALRVELAEQGVRVGVAYFGLIDTGMVRDIVSSTGFGGVLATLPRFLSRPAPVTAAAAVLVSGIARRANRVFAPGYVRLLLDLRTMLALGDPLIARHRFLANVIRAANGGIDTEVSS